MKKQIMTALTVVFGVILTAAIIGILLTVLAETQSATYGAMDYILACCLIFTLTFGVYYLLSGCKKGEGSKYYVGYMGALAVCDLIAVTDTARLPVAGTVAVTVAVASHTVLCFSKDLGQLKSAIFSVLGLAAEAGVFVFFLTGNAGAFSMNSAAAVVLAATAVFMVFAKYYDKSLRGSK